MSATPNRFWDGIATKYSKQKISEPEAYEKKLALTQEYLKPESKVFEFGCGTGSTALRHSKYAGSIVATDISEKMIEIANEKVQKDDIGNVEFLRTTLDDYECEPSTFDMVMAHSILHLVPDRDVALNKCYELLKPGGILVSSAPCVSLMFKPIISVMKLFGKAPPVSYFNRGQLEESVEKAGFKILKSLNLNKDKSTVFIVAEK